MENYLIKPSLSSQAISKKQDQCLIKQVELEMLASSLLPHLPLQQWPAPCQHSLLQYLEKFLDSQLFQ